MSSLTPTSSPAASPTAIPTLGDLASLEDALAGGEVLATRAIARPNLVYAVKNGRHVTVLMRNVMTGGEQTLLEYDERKEARHSANFWEELPPSVALSPAAPVLVYTAERDVMAYDLDDKTTKTLLRSQEREPFPDGGAKYAWVSDSGAELCCAFGLAAPVVSPDGASVVLSMVQYEGMWLGVSRLDGSLACVVAGADDSYPISADPVWNPKTGELLVPSGGTYSPSGLFLVGEDAPCGAGNIAKNIHDEGAVFESAAWSPDGERAVTSFLSLVLESNTSNLLLLRRDGSEARTLVGEGFNSWPLFSTDGGSVYFVRRVVEKPNGGESLWRFDLVGGRADRLVDIPSGWSVRPQGWTSEGYLELSAWSTGCVYPSCDNRLLLLDVATGGVLYASAATDFTRYLRFLP